MNVSESLAVDCTSFPSTVMNTDADVCFEAHRTYLYRLAISSMKGRGFTDYSVSDLVQDIYASAWRRYSEGTGPEPFMTRFWLGGILKNKLRSRLRYRARGKRDSQNEVSIGIHEQHLTTFRAGLDPAAAVAGNDNFEWAMAALPEEQRVVIVLYLQYGMTMSESAQALGIKEDCARMRYRRGLEFLKPLLEREVVQESAIS